MNLWLGIILDLIIIGELGFIIYVQTYGIPFVKKSVTKTIAEKPREMPKCQFCGNILGKIQQARSGQLCCDKCAVTVFGEFPQVG